MSGIYTAVTGDRGRVLVPTELRVRHGFEECSSLIFMELRWGLVLTRREALLARIQTGLEGGDLVEEILIEWKREAAIEDAG